MIIDNLDEVGFQDEIRTGKPAHVDTERTLDVADMLAALKWQARAQAMYDMWRSAMSNGLFHLRSVQDKKDIMETVAHPGGRDPSEVFALLSARVIGRLAELEILECKSHDDMMSIAVIATRSEDDSQWAHDLGDFAASFMSACGRDTVDVQNGVEKALGRRLSDRECYFLFDHIERDRARPNREQIAHLVRVFDRAKQA